MKSNSVDELGLGGWKIWIRRGGWDEVQVDEEDSRVASAEQIGKWLYDLGKIDFENTGMQRNVELKKVWPKKSDIPVDNLISNLDVVCWVVLHALGEE